MVANGAIRVDTLRVNFKANGERYHDIFVKNIGKSTEYVQVDLFKRSNPGVDPQQKEPAKGNPRSFGLVVTPRKLAIAPGHTKRLRILNLKKPRKEELVYGIHVKPVKSPLERRLDAENKSTAGGVRITATFLVSVYVMPTNPHADVSLKREGKTLIVRNKGNVNALLDKGQQCDKNKNCTKIEPIRLYANSARKLILKKPLPVTFQEVTFNRNIKIKSY